MMRSAMVLVVGLCVLIFSALSSLASSGRVALVIGNSAYSQVEKIRNPGNDATAIGAALRRMGFEVTVVHDATKVEFDSALSTFSDVAAGQISPWYSTPDTEWSLTAPTISFRRMPL